MNPNPEKDSPQRTTENHRGRKKIFATEERG
jgi:hypothetical protein